MVFVPSSQDLKPIGGSLKSFPEDFVVEELPLDEDDNAAEEELPFLRFRLKKLHHPKLHICFLLMIVGICLVAWVSLKTKAFTPKRHTLGYTGAGPSHGLRKRGLDTLEAVDALARACHLPSQKFGFAGIKDSFAITTQEISENGVRVRVDKKERWRFFGR